MMSKVFHILIRPDVCVCLCNLVQSYVTRLSADAMVFSTERQNGKKTQEVRFALCRRGNFSIIFWVIQQLMSVSQSSILGI